MTQEFISYEQALSLKELGFDEPCFYPFIPPYDDLDARIDTCYVDYKNWNEKPKLVSAPLKSQVFKWFREKHKLNGEVFAQQRPSDNFMYGFKIVGGNTNTMIYDGFDTYEEAELACIKKLIEIVKQPKKD